MHCLRGPLTSTLRGKKAVLGVAGKENCQPVTFLPPLPPDKLKLHSVRVVAAEGCAESLAPQVSGDSWQLGQTDNVIRWLDPQPNTLGVRKKKSWQEK